MAVVLALYFWALFSLGGGAMTGRLVVTLGGGGEVEQGLGAFCSLPLLSPWECTLPKHRGNPIWVLPIGMDCCYAWAMGEQDPRKKCGGWEGLSVTSRCFGV